MLAFVASLLLTFASSSLADDRIVNLPGWNGTQAMYAGYINVNVSHGRNLFYWLVEAQESPATAPLVLWTNGGEPFRFVGEEKINKKRVSISNALPTPQTPTRILDTLVLPPLLHLCIVFESYLNLKALVALASLGVCLASLAPSFPTLMALCH